jgi:hypothetical protein
MYVCIQKTPTDTLGLRTILYILGSIALMLTTVPRQAYSKLLTYFLFPFPFYFFFYFSVSLSFENALYSSYCINSLYYKLSIH